ncbi:hypothetical protein AURDEDRAFT_163974 [Auricularia subglabra TFB-10046 SS5]|nr:hypothetical protein AURDEDRAFT_163974 [Auricularia subglabra TFB-10046 SS5]
MFVPSPSSALQRARTLALGPIAAPWEAVLPTVDGDPSEYDSDADADDASDGEHDWDEFSDQPPDDILDMLMSGIQALDRLVPVEPERMDIDVHCDTWPYLWLELRLASRSTLRITVPWRDFLSTIFVEHAAVCAEYDCLDRAREVRSRNIVRRLSRGRLEPEEGRRLFNSINGDSSKEASVTVRRRRFGEDVAEKRMEKARRTAADSEERSHSEDEDEAQEADLAT